MKRRSSCILSAAAIVSYSLSAAYVILDLWRVGASYTVNPEAPLSITYISDRTDGLSHAVSYIFIVEVRTLWPLFLVLLARRTPTISHILPLITRDAY